MRCRSINLGASFLFFVVYIVLMCLNPEMLHGKALLFSWIGVLQLLYILFTQNRILKTWFNLYSIFVLFCFLFNFGQCLLWAFGIHMNGEISNSVYKSISISEGELVRGQVFFLGCMQMLHCGFCLFCKSPQKKNQVCFIAQNNNSGSLLFKVSAIALLIVLPVTVVDLIRQIRIASQFGYSSLYYGELSVTHPVVVILTQLFFICLIGLLVGSKYDKKVMVFVYFVFGIFVILDLLKGDRGNWIYRLCVLIWMHHRFYKRISFKKALLIVACGFLSLYLVQAIVSVRDSKITTSAVKEALSFRNNPVISSVFEMGNQMQINIIVANKSVDYPFGNTYLLGGLSAVSMKIPALFGIDYVPLSTWFSSNYLNLDYGAAFTMFGELGLNFGVLFAPLFSFFLGGLSCLFLNVERAINKGDALAVFFSIGLSTYFINAIRNTAHDFIKYSLFGCVLITMVVWVLKSAMQKKSGNYEQAEGLINEKRN